MVVAETALFLPKHPVNPGYPVTSDDELPADAGHLCSGIWNGRSAVLGPSLPPPGHHHQSFQMLSSTLPWKDQGIGQGTFPETAHRRIDHAHRVVGFFGPDRPDLHLPEPADAGGYPERRQEYHYSCSARWKCAPCTRNTGTR